MKKRLLLMLMAATLVTSCFTGCGKKERSGRADRGQVETEKAMTMDDIVKEVSKVDIDSADMKGTAEIDMSMSAMGFQVDMNIDMDITGALDKDGRTYADGTVTLNMADKSGALSENNETHIGTYSFVEDGATYTYQKLDSYDWMLSDVKDKTSTNNFTQVKNALVNGVSSSAKLNKKTEDVNGHECYVISYSGTVQDFAELVGGSLNGSGLTDLTSYGISADDFLEKVKADVDIYVDKDDFYIRRYIIDFGRTDMSELMEAFGVNPSSSGIDKIELSKFYIDTTFDNINNVTVSDPSDFDREDADSYYYENDYEYDETDISVQEEDVDIEEESEDNLEEDIEE